LCSEIGKVFDEDRTAWNPSGGTGPADCMVSAELELESVFSAGDDCEVLKKRWSHVEGLTSAKIVREGGNNNACLSQ